ncbi:MAG: SpoIID/LytB domain-containing protein [Planctomycetota bacterium]|jgi:stage II sporulation protein D
MQLSRRAFLGSLAVVASAAVPSGCRRDSQAAASAKRRSAADASSALPGLPGAEPVVRVRVLKVRGPRTLQLGADGDWIRLSRVDDKGQTLAGVAMAGPLEIVNDAGWSITDAKGFQLRWGGLETISISGLEDDDPTIALGQRRYPGSIRLAPRSDAGPEAFDVVNHVAMESYLPGVVTKELYDPRSFACAEHAEYSKRRHYELTDSASSQAYIGSVDHRRARDAVTMTRGMVLSYDGTLVPGYYSSCCGGVSACGVDAIGRRPINDLPPLRGRGKGDVCTGASVYQWLIERPAESLRQRLMAFGQAQRRQDLAKVGRIATIDVVARNEHGRPTRYAIADGDGKRVELSAASLRRAANWSVDGLPDPKRLWSSYLEVTVDEDRVRFDGRGYGHGVGLCQHGAEALARDGKDHQAILAWYYPGAQVVVAY